MVSQYMEALGRCLDQQPNEQREERGIMRVVQTSKLCQKMSIIQG